MTTANQLAGLVGSLLIYLASLSLAGQARTGLIRRMSPAMREHVAESNEPTVRSVLAEWRTRTTWGWLLTVLVPFVVVLVSGISFGLEVLFIAAVAVMFAAFAAQDDREALTSSAAEFGLAVERSPVTISWVTTTFLSTLGWVGIAAFLAGVVAVAIR